MIRRIWKSLITSIAGVVVGAPTLIIGIEEKNTVLIVTGIGAVILGLLAKDKKLNPGEEAPVDQVKQDFYGNKKK